MIEILYFEGCPNHKPTVDLVREVVEEMGHSAEIREVSVETAEEADHKRFLGSPSVRVNGRDIEPEARDRADYTLGCRIYSGGGVPSKQLLVDALLGGS
jgi:hypothetical protein